MLVELHGKTERVDQNHGEYRILEHGRGDECPQLVLYRIFRDIPADGLCVERKLDAVPLVLVQLAVLVGRLSLLLEGDNDKTDEDVHHEEGDDNDIDEIEHGHDGSVVVDGADVLGVGIDGNVQDSGIKKLVKRS